MAMIGMTNHFNVHEILNLVRTPLLLHPLEKFRFRGRYRTNSQPCEIDGLLVKISGFHLRLSKYRPIN